MRLKRERNRRYRGCDGLPRSTADPFASAGASRRPRRAAGPGGLPRREVFYSSERHHFDFDEDGLLSDDERDEDADGLTNYDEAHGRLLPAYWTACYTKEAAYPVPYAGTGLTDPDSDGDGVRDGADDQDHDDVPNLMEMSRNAASGRTIANSCDDAGATVSATPERGWVNPFNPCLPDRSSRTCARHPDLGARYAPFDPNTPRYLVLN